MLRPFAPPQRRRWEGTSSSGAVVQAAEGEDTSSVLRPQAFLGHDALGAVDIARERTRSMQQITHTASRATDGRADRASALFLAGPAGLRLTAARSEPALHAPPSLRERQQQQLRQPLNFNLGYRVAEPTLSHHQRRQREAEQESAEKHRLRLGARPRRVVYVSHSFVHPPTGLTAAYVKHTDHVSDALVPIEACAWRPR